MCSTEPPLCLPEDTALADAEDDLLRGTVVGTPKAPWDMRIALMPLLVGNQKELVAAMTRIGSARDGKVAVSGHQRQRPRRQINEVLTAEAGRKC